MVISSSFHLFAKFKRSLLRSLIPPKARYSNSTSIGSIPLSISGERESSFIFSIMSFTFDTENTRAWSSKIQRNETVAFQHADKSTASSLHCHLLEFRSLYREVRSKNRRCISFACRKHNDATPNQRCSRFSYCHTLHLKHPCL